MNFNDLRWILIAVVVIVVVVLFIVLIINSKKTGDKSSAKVKVGNVELEFGISPGDKNKLVETKNSSIPNTVNKPENLANTSSVASGNINTNKKPLSANLLKTHVFFTSTIPTFTKNSYDFTLYERMCKSGIKTEDSKVKAFKRIIATKYLNNCLFGYLSNIISKWVEKSIDEYNSSTADEVPQSFYDIFNSIILYRDEVQKIASNIEFEFDGKLVRGIPREFIETLNEYASKDITSIQNSLRLLIFSSDVNTWFQHLVEILDVCEVFFSMILNDIDATLVVLNGEMESYVNKLLS